MASGTFTPRGKADSATSVTDDAVMKAGMKALLTPRSSAAMKAMPSVDDTPMAGAVNKMFKGMKLQHV